MALAGVESRNDRAEHCCSSSPRARPSCSASTYIVKCAEPRGAARRVGQPLVSVGAHGAGVSGGQHRAHRVSRQEPVVRRRGLRHCHQRGGPAHDQRTSTGRATWWPARASASSRPTWPTSRTATAGAASPSGAMWAWCPATTAGVPGLCLTWRPK
ncbi:MAG: hypothetical protein WKG07_29445 [Hymenobacter sp.]